MEYLDRKIYFKVEIDWHPESSWLFSHAFVLLFGNDVFIGLQIISSLASDSWVDIADVGWRLAEVWVNLITVSIVGPLSSGGSAQQGSVGRRWLHLWEISRRLSSQVAELPRSDSDTIRRRLSMNDIRRHRGDLLEFAAATDRGVAR